MSRVPAYLPLFGSDYLADTSHLSTEEHGAYLLLMIAAWRQDDCSLPADDKKLARIVGLSVRKWGQIKDTILEFWTVEKGRIYQPRLLKEWTYACKKSEGNRENARKRWSAQHTENINGDVCDRISDGNAPQPQPQKEEEPNGSPSPPLSPKTKSKPSSSKVPMTPDWSPADLSGDVGEMLAEWPDGRLEQEITDFREYWTEAGEKRPGWDRTFRSRIRTIHPRVMRDSQNGNQPRQANGIAPAGNYRKPDRRDSFSLGIDDGLGIVGPNDYQGSAGQSDLGFGSGGGELIPARTPTLR